MPIIALRRAGQSIRDRGMRLQVLLELSVITVLPTSEKVDIAGVVFRVGVDGGMTFRE